MPRRVNMQVNCSHCNEVFEPTAYQRWRIRTKIGYKPFCSQNCYHQSMIGEGNPNWRGGKTISKKYVYVYHPDHTYADHHGYVLEHRLVMEKMLGRYLSPKEVVHHINGNTRDNRPENLMLLPSESEHRKLHCKYRTRVNGMFAGHAEGVTLYI